MCDGIEDFGLLFVCVIVGVKGKEEVAGALVGTVRGAGGPAAAARLLAAAAALEVRRAPHAALAFRANSLATKATEAYMKMLGETYLQVCYI